MTSLIRYAMIWRRWRLFIAEGVQQRQAATRAIARMKHRLLSSCFEMWAEETKRLLEGREQVLTLATARMLHLELSSACKCSPRRHSLFPTGARARDGAHAPPGALLRLHPMG